MLLVMFKEKTTKTREERNVTLGQTSKVSIPKRTEKDQPKKGPIMFVHEYVCQCVCVFVCGTV